MGTEQIGTSLSHEYSTPLSLVSELIEEFDLHIDVAASAQNAKLPHYWTIKDDALSKTWKGNCWINPPYSRDLKKWVKKAHSERHSGTKVCLIPVRSNTKWWSEVCRDSEIRFINGEVNFNDKPRGLWAALCIMIFGEGAKVGTFSVIDYRKGKLLKNGL